MKNQNKRILCFFVIMTIIFSTLAPLAYGYESDTPRLDESNRLLRAFGNRYRFTDFMIDHAHLNRPNAEYIIPAAEYSFVEGMNISHHENFVSMPGISIETEEVGLIEWEVYVQESGLYNISVTYFPLLGRSSDIQRAIFINGELPFFEANPIEFRRIWVDALPYIQQDAQGNDQRPAQIEAPKWIESIIMDPIGTYNEPFSFYLQEGLNTIGFVSLREPMMINNIRVHQAPPVVSYEVFSRDNIGRNKPSVSNISPLRIEGHESARRSSPMLAAQADTGGPGVQPYSTRNIRINHVGGNSWNIPGSWVEWEFEIEEAGLYNIAMNIRQNFHRGASSFRRITINGEVPFTELAEVPFPFANGWRVETLGNDDEPFLIWFDKGTHTIRMEAVLGAYAEYAREIQESVLILNELYREIVMITGVAPDRFRDYQIEMRIPHLESALRAERVRLERIFEELGLLAVGRGDRDAMIRSMARMLTRLYTDVENIPVRLGQFREHIGGMGTWLMLVREQMLAVDAIYILPYDAPTPDNGRRWWRQIWHEIRTFFTSFFIDYNSIGSPIESDRTVEVWLGTGRDQASIIMRMITETFAPYNNIDVSLKLIDMGTLLPATVAGQGPDIALGVGNALPMDFGMRGAAASISGFSDFNEVTERFPEAAMVPYRFEDRVFALPETITFPMLFYRRDILHEIGLEPPQTWDDVRAAIARLSMNNMTFGLPVGDFPHFSYFMFLYQMGGTVYSEDSKRTALDTEIGLSAFREFTRFYLEYNLERQFDFANRFRFGEMPLGVSDYTTYNLLQVFAPEIRGLWGFMPVPGTIMEDGSINRTIPTGGTAVIMMENAKDPDAAWEFMKWWTSADTQTRFGREMEALMGAAARHPTANLEAFSRMPWPLQDYLMLSEAFETIKGIPEVPGGYFTPRQVRNAFFTTVELRSMTAREALTDFSRFINDEIRIKRREFGLPY